MHFLNVIQEISSVSSMKELRQIIFKIINYYGLSSFNYGIQIPSINQKETPYIFSGYEQKWIEHYVSNKYHEVDATVLYSFKNIAPTIWTDEHFKTSPKLRDESKDAGLLNGITFPIHGSLGEKGLFCVAGPEQISTESYLLLNAIVPFIHEKILQLELSEKNYFQLPKLTLKETEFLKWLVIGKTMEEISIIMNISYRTCSDYSEKLKRKFKCTSKAQIISSAISKGVINI